MEIRAQPVASGTQIAGTPERAASIVARWRAETHTASEPIALRSAVRLLTEAGRALPESQNNARKYILRAAALLQAESDCREHEPKSIAGTTGGGLAPWQVTRVMRFIDANLRGKIGPQDFAHLTRLSSGHFTRAFRATVGESPHAFLIRRRIDRAKELMLETDLPLAQIAFDCGLTDQAHMTRLFNRVVGISPGAWRRAHVATINNPSREQDDQSQRFADRGRLVQKSDVQTILNTPELLSCPCSKSSAGDCNDRQSGTEARLCYCRRVW